MISVSNVTISHRGLPVVRDVSFEMAPGDVVVIGGETGSGKTSLIRAMYGDLALESGSITIDGIEMRRLKRSQLPPLRRRMGLIFQDTKLLEDRSVYDNIRFALSVQLHSQKEIKRRAMTILSELGLSHLLPMMPSQLSGGEAQRIGVARALANDPQIILADEPTGNLDPDTATDIFSYLASHHDPERAMLIATHDVDRALAVLPNARRMVLQKGELRELD